MVHGKISESIIAPSSRFYHGPFGRICSDLPPWAPKNVSDDALEAHFMEFANASMVEAPDKLPSEIAEDDDLRKELEARFSSKIPAGYTYFGQFIDHDITLDTTPLSDSEIDPNRLHNFRTPRLDLDCVYGTGPDNQPYLYEHAAGQFTGKLLTGTVPDTPFPDLLRNREGRAIIGDMRNDENAIVAQIQLAFILAHNKLVQRALDMGLAKDGKEAFPIARRTLRWLYQWIVWNDFIVRIAVDEIHGCALEAKDACGGRKVWHLGLSDIYLWKVQPFMPVEFSVAAYRFGHSMARNSYQTNSSREAGAGFSEFIPLFDVNVDSEDDLSGFRPLNAKRIVQWDWFLQMESSRDPFPQLARKIDTKLSNALAHLREDPENPGSLLNILAARNLVRSVRMRLPSGIDVARKFGVKPLTLDADEPEALWYYVLKEAQTLPGSNGGQMLGRVGSMIVCATFAGLLKGDGTSWLNVHPHWTPDEDALLKQEDKRDNGKWTLASIIRLSGLPVDEQPFA